MSRKDSVNACKRPRIRFGLRSIFSVTFCIALIAGWIGYENQLATRRRVLIRKVSSQLRDLPEDHYVISGCYPPLSDYYTRSTYLNRYRRWRGYPVEPVIFSIQSTAPVFDDDALGTVLRKLFKCPDVEINQAYLFNSSVTDEGLRLLAKRSDLQSVFIGHDPFIRGEISYASTMGPHLPGRDVTDKGLAYLADLENLVEVCLYNTRISRVGLETLASMKSLRVLWLIYNEDPLQEVLTGPMFSDSDLDVLSSMTGLQELCISSMTLDGTGVELLAKALPECNVRSSLGGCYPPSWGAPPTLPAPQP